MLNKRQTNLNNGIINTRRKVKEPWSKTLTFLFPFRKSKKLRCRVRVSLKFTDIFRSHDKNIFIFHFIRYLNFDKKLILFKPNLLLCRKKVE